MSGDRADGLLVALHNCFVLNSFFKVRIIRFKGVCFSIGTSVYYSLYIDFFHLSPEGWFFKEFLPL